MDADSSSGTTKVPIEGSGDYTVSLCPDRLL